MKLFLKVLIVLLLLGSIPFWAGSTSAQLFVFDNPLIGKKAPDFTLSNTKGEKMSLAQFSNGQPTVLFFWATWCPHCREQIKQINKTKDDFVKKGIKLMLIDVGEPSAQVAKHLTKTKIDLDSFVDEDSQVSTNYGLIGVPTFFFVNKEGVIKGQEYFLPKTYEDFFKDEKK
jgi:peroxiredoxin